SLALATASIEGAPPPAAEPSRPYSGVQASEPEEAPAGPISLEVAYTADVMGNVAGGVQRGARYLDNFDVVLGADLEALTGWTGATLGVYGLYNNGNSISDLVGDTQGVSNIETGV